MAEIENLIFRFCDSKYLTNVDLPAPDGAEIMINLAIFIFNSNSCGLNILLKDISSKEYSTPVLLFVQAHLSFELLFVAYPRG